MSWDMDDVVVIILVVAIFLIPAISEAVRDARK